MSGRKRRPGDDYEVGFGKPPKRTQYPKGVSGNPNGRPRKKPDTYTELTRVLRAPVTVTSEGEKRRVTVQQALLLRLRDEAVRGQIWAGKLLQKVVDAIPDSGGEFDHIELQVGLFHAKTRLLLMLEDAEREKANQKPDPTEAGNVE
jgi:hypothetical protein